MTSLTSVTSVTSLTSLTSLNDHQLLVLWVQLAALLFSARALGAAARRLGQPAVVGELLAGLLLGPSVFGQAWPAGFAWFVGRSGGSAPLAAVAQVSLIALLVVIGAETDLRLIRRLGSAAAWVSAGSLLIPCAAGAALAVGLPTGLVGGRGGRPVFALLMGTAMGVSSLPVIARIVTDLGLTRRDVGQVAIAAGTANDAVGFFLLALGTGLTGGGRGEVVLAAVGVVAISFIALTVGQRVLDAVLRHVRRSGPNVVGSLGVCVVASFVSAAGMQAIGVEGALGAFVAGVALGRSRFQQGRALGVLETMTTTVFSPLYFATAGLRMDLTALRGARMLLSLAAVIAVAAVSKYAGSFAGAWAARMPMRERRALGVALNGRGALQVIVASGALGAGVFSIESYTVVILLSMVSSLATAPLLRRLLHDWPGTRHEQERLEREAELDRNVIVRGQRLLLVGGGRRSTLPAARVLAAAWPVESEVTLLSATDGAGPAADVLSPRSVEQRHVPAEELVDGVLSQSLLGYGVIAVGAPDRPVGDRLFSPALDDLLTKSPIPVLLVRPARERGSGFSKIVVPVSGSASSRAGQEVALNLGRSLGSQVVMAHVVTRPDAEAERLEGALEAAARVAGETASPDVLPAGPEGAAAVVVGGASALASEMSVPADIVVAHADSVGEGVLQAALDSGADTIAVGITLRTVGGRPFLGHGVERMLEQFDGTVVLVVLPEHVGRLGAMVAEVSGHS